MTTHRRRFTTNAVALAVLLLLPYFSSPAHAQNCNRQCLTGMMTQFIDALVAHDPSKLPVAENVRRLSRRATRPAE